MRTINQTSLTLFSERLEKLFEKNYNSSRKLPIQWPSEPFVPGVEFVDENGEPNLPTEKDFEFVIFPDGNNPDYDEPMVYE